MVWSFPEGVCSLSLQPLRISLIRSHKKGALRTRVGDLFLDPLKRGESTQKARVAALRCIMRHVLALFS